MTPDELRALADEWERLGIPDDELPIALARLCAEMGEALEIAETIAMTSAQGWELPRDVVTALKRVERDSRAALAKLAKLEAPK